MDAFWKIDDLYFNDNTTQHNLSLININMRS